MSGSLGRTVWLNAKQSLALKSVVRKAVKEIDGKMVEKVGNRENMKVLCREFTATSRKRSFTASSTGRAEWRFAYICLPEPL